MADKAAKREKRKPQVGEKARPNKSPGKDKKHKTEKKLKSGANAKNSTSTFSLLAAQKSLDPAISSLFGAQPTPPTRSIRKSSSPSDEDDSDLEFGTTAATPATVQSIGETGSVRGEDDLSSLDETSKLEPKRKRKRKDDEDNLEAAYLSRLAREEARETNNPQTERQSKRKKESDQEHDEVEQDAVEVLDDAGEGELADEDEILSPPPKHETEEATEFEVDKVKRTVFLGNVSTAAISSKASRRILLDHLKSFFGSVRAPLEGESKHKIESIRFRSTPYASAVPKKAAFAKKDVMDATTKSTNAYVVYSSQSLAREAARRLNGTVILDRHLRADEVAHPAKVDARRCVFVGNLGFVDDERNGQTVAEGANDPKKRKPGKQPGDVEEGLWRVFGKCGTVESVRVIRDSKTRISKGVAYVQFVDGSAVEAALLYDGKKFPPMLPRTLRVTRARALKRNAAAGSGRTTAKPSAGGYQKKISGAEQSQMGRASRLFGRAGAAEMKRHGNAAPMSKSIKTPEAFVFEGHRASSTGGRSGMKMGKRSKKGGKPTSRSAKRGEAFKKAKKKT